MRSFKYKEKSYKEILSSPKDILKALPIALLYDICVCAFLALIVPFTIIFLVSLIFQAILGSFKFNAFNLLFYLPVKLEKKFFADHGLFIDIWHIFKVLNAIMIALIVSIHLIVNGTYLPIIFVVIASAILGYITVELTKMAMDAYLTID